MDQYESICGKTGALGRTSFLNVGKKITTTRSVITQKSAVLVYVVAEAWYHS